MKKEILEVGKEKKLEKSEQQEKQEKLQQLVISQLMQKQAEQEANVSDSEVVIYENLFIPSFSTVSIEKFKLVQELNKHFKMTFSAVVSEDDNDNAVYYTQVGSQVEVKYTLKGFSKQKTLFKGLVTDVKVKTVGDVSMLYVTAHSNTIMLDAAKNSYSYQDKGRTYQSVVEEVLKRNQGASAIFSGAASAAIGDFMIQYKETDWEFIKRIASQKNLALVPDYTASKPKFYYGCQYGEKTHKIKPVEYTAEKNIQTFQKDSRNYIDGIEEKEYITYTVKSNQLFKLGDAVTFKDIQFYIRKAVYEMEQGIVVGTYQLGRKSYFKQRRKYNIELSGISLNGSVVAINRDKIKVALSIDGNKAETAKYWFPYSTMSASPDGSGWYCMPKEGDQVRVYFPDVKEKNCYAISSISSYSPPAGSTDKMSDPNVRYLRTPDGMEIKLDPSGITIDAYDGKAVISLDKQGNITINATKDLKVTAAQGITFNAEKDITMYATKDISMKGAGGSIELKENGDTVLTGQYVLEN
ncbi:MAG: hypothetical protein II838_07010 [Lachnospiraceae bacterium]|nr:hypothetical protein [Lachnospiraceae bacterium]